MAANDPHPAVTSTSSPSARALSGGSFPRLSARTQRFTLGRPRDIRVSDDGQWVTWLRAPSGEDPRTCLWALDVEDGRPRLVADPAFLLGVEGGAELTAAERARRERVRESASGIVSYARDASGRNLAFVLAGQIFVSNVVSGEVAPWPTTEAAFDARLDPTGRRVAYVAGAALRCIDADGHDVQVVGEPGGGSGTVSWGSAEFVAAEEMGRERGYWWDPTGERLAVARVDVAPVQEWWITDPSDPGAPPRPIRYPAAGTANADVTLSVVELGAERRVEVKWDHDAFPYLADVQWDAEHGLMVVVQSRDQRTVEVRVADPQTGETTARRVLSDPLWVDLVPGSPCWWDDRLATVADDGGTRRLLVDDEAVTEAGFWVRAISGTGGGRLWFTASSEPTTVDVCSFDGRAVEVHTDGAGLYGVAVGGTTRVVSRADLDHDGTSLTVISGDGAQMVLDDVSMTPPLTPRPALARLGSRQIATAVLLPTGHDPTAGPLPVLCDPYGGPHAQRVVRSRAAFLASQWFADQGFAVVVADGRGTPGRGDGWEQAVAGDLAGPALDDQIDALHTADRWMPGVLDLSRVAIRGWSFGGYLAALAVLRRPEVFSAAVAGAPVTDWGLYDTHYTERYLGDPAAHPERYAATSLLNEAASLRRPLMLIHGLADDNVVAAHTLQFSRALLEAGRPHQVLPLLGVTHMTPQEAVAENLLLLQLEFLRAALGMAGGS